jgi:uncharacterized cysteine cluster protein YcgN (CxxCxxCC family)
MAKQYFGPCDLTLTTKTAQHHFYVDSVRCLGLEGKSCNCKVQQWILKPSKLL